MLKTGPGRGAVGRRHVPRRDRAPAVDPEGLAGSGSTCAPGTTWAGIYRVFPVGDDAAADPAARQARHRRAGRRARQPQRLAARHGAAAARLERQDKSAVAAAGKARGAVEEPAGPAARAVHAGRAGGAEAGRAEAARWRDEHPGVRRHAVRLAEPLLAKRCRTWATRSPKLADDPDAHVRHAAGVLAGRVGRPAGGGGAWRSWRVRSGDDPFILTAVLSSVNKSNFNPVAEGVAPPREGRQAPPTSPDCSSGLFRIAAGLHEDGASSRCWMRSTTPQDGKIAAWQYATIGDAARPPRGKRPDAGEPPAGRRAAAVAQAGRGPVRPRPGRSPPTPMPSVASDRRGRACSAAHPGAISRTM